MEAESATDEAAVEDWLCVALGEASRAMSRRYNDVLAPWGLTYPQYIAMSWVWQEGDLSISELAERMGLDPSTLSPLVKRLEGAGVVTRRRDAADERRVLVSATRRGVALQRDVAHVPREVSEATGLSARGQHRLVSSLRRLTASLTAT